MSAGLRGTAESKDSRHFALCSLLFALGLKKQEARSFLTGLLIGWIKLKDRSAGGWRSGMQRSEK